MKNDEYFIREAIKQADKGITNNEGGPFGAIVVKNGEIVGRGNNKVTSTNDPTAHAEMVAIRDACKNLSSFQLDDCIIYSSCEPCPMCLGAIYWARPERVVYAATAEDADKIAGFDDSFIYTELATEPGKRKIPALNALREEGVKIFEAWKAKEDKILY